MRRLQLCALALSLAACGGGSSGDTAQSGAGDSSSSGGSSEGSSEGSAGGGSADGSGGSGGGSGGDSQFQLSDSDTAGQAHGESESQIEATRTHAAMRLFVTDPATGPIPDIVIKMTGPNGRSYYTNPTDAQGYGEVLVPVGQRYELEYLALGARNTTANVNVPTGPNQDIRLTLRWRRRPPPPPRPPVTPSTPAPDPEGLVLDGILFDTGRATIQAESFPRLDRVVEYMTHMSNVRIGISGHTDNVGNPRRNQALSEARAQAVRTYLIEHGIDGGRVEAVGFGDERPVASNDTDEGRAQNRRIEAIEL